MTERDSIKARNNQIEINAGVSYDIHQKDRGLSWKHASKFYLVKRLLEEILEEIIEFLNNPDYDEAGDVLNFMSMIIAHKREGLSNFDS